MSGRVRGRKRAGERKRPPGEARRRRLAKIAGSLPDRTPEKNCLVSGKRLPAGMPNRAGRQEWTRKLGGYRGSRSSKKGPLKPPASGRARCPIHLPERSRPLEAT